jgi:hypothetical protein
MTDAANSTTDKPTRNRLFSRIYNYEGHTVSIEVDGGESRVVKWEDLSEAAKIGFALQGFQAWATGPATKVYSDTGDKAKALELLDNGIKAAQSGDIDLYTGQAGTGTSGVSAMALVGRAAVEAGKSFITFKGIKHPFTNEAEASKVMSMLYQDTSENTVDKHSMTGRQLYNVIADMEEIASRVRAYRKAKTAPEGALG